MPEANLCSGIASATRGASTATATYGMLDNSPDDTRVRPERRIGGSASTPRLTGMTPSHGVPAALSSAKYVELTTFRRTGVPVRTPVWAAVPVDAPDRLAVISVDGTGKTKRLAHTARVELRPCSIRGEVASDAPTFHGRATVVRDPEGVALVRRAVVAKYGLPARFSDLVEAVTSRVGIRRAPRAGILIDVDA